VRIRRRSIKINYDHSVAKNWKIPLSFHHEDLLMQNKMTRRSIVKSGLIAGALVPAFGLIGGTAGAAALTPLDANDPTAKALGFVADASKVDAASNPTYKPAQKCSTCAQYLGKAGDATAGCNIIAGHTVPAGGWCKVWAAKPV
jgi:hypothetical protein